MNMDPFRTLVRTEGVRLYRDLPWRRTHDPYEIWLSEVMLQQTQVARVETRWAEWLDRFPSVFALAEAGTAEVLAAWQGTTAVRSPSRPPPRRSCARMTACFPRASRS